jgi:SAM-dependent methyltransferase
MSSGGKVTGVRREHAYGQTHRLTPVDRFGVWLSARQIRRHAGSLAGIRLGDFGCGYHASFVRSVLGELQAAVLVDVAIADDLKQHPKVTAVEGVLPEALAAVPSASLDLVMSISVLEHLWEPLTAVRECRRIVRPGGVCLFNVPSWRGKWFLEFSAYRLGLSPREEIEDHKTYYDVSDLYPLLVRAGFRERDIQCFAHKFGLNTFAVCKNVP